MPSIDLVFKKPWKSGNPVDLVFGDDGSGDMILTSGQAAIGVWSTSDGKLVARGQVTDEAGQGHFKLLGSTGTQLYAGGKAILGETRIA